MTWQAPWIRMPQTHVVRVQTAQGAAMVSTQVEIAIAPWAGDWRVSSRREIRVIDTGELLSLETEPELTFNNVSHAWQAFTVRVTTMHNDCDYWGAISPLAGARP